MGILQTTLLNQSSAQVIDGSLKFIGSTINTSLRRAFSDGNRRTFTISVWVKHDTTSENDRIFNNYTDGSNYAGLYFRDTPDFQIAYAERLSGNFDILCNSTAMYRDTGWYHVVLAVDTTQAVASERIKMYVNGNLEPLTGPYSNGAYTAAATFPSQNYQTQLAQSSGTTEISPTTGFSSGEWEGQMSQFYYIDGQQLGPRFFGFNDPLTGTWRPRKLREGDITVNDGTVWSSGIPGNNHADYPVTNAFDGNTSTFVYAAGTSTMTWTAPTPVSGKKIEVYVYAGGNWPPLLVNGQSTGAAVGGTTQHNVWVDVTHLCPGGILNTIQASGQNIGGTDRQSGFAAVRVDGEILVDRKIFKSNNPNDGTTWSSTTDTGLTHADGVTGIFDGSLATRGGAPSTDNTYAILTNNVSIPCTNGIRIYWNGVGSGQRYIRINGTTELDDGSAQLTPGWSPLSSFSGTINKIEVKTASSGSWSLAAIEVDGQILIDGKQNNSFYLPMDGNSPVGEDKSGVTTINDGTIWSSYVTAANTMYNYDGSAMTFGGGYTGFDGKLNTRIDDWNGVYNSNHNYQLEFVPPTPIPFKYKVEVYTVAGPQSPYDNDFFVDTGSGYSPAINHVQNSWVTLATGTGSLTKIKSTANQNGTSWTAIKIDGVILIDGIKGNDFRPINIGSVELDNPIVSGARPILNTTQGGTQAGVGVFGSLENKYYTVTTANGSVYQFDITSGDNPSLEFIRGATYRFDYSSHTGHPVLFSSTNPDSSTTAYTTGTSIASNVISFTVPHDAPDTLYYYCSAHPTNMNGAISVTTDETKADPYASSCILAVPGVGGNYNDISAQINCTSTTKAVSAGGDPASSLHHNLYNSSISLDGNDKLTYTRTNAGDFSGQGDYTIEAWFYTAAHTTDAAVISNWDSGNNRSILFGPNASGTTKLSFIFNTTGSGAWTTLSNAQTSSLGKWYHMAWVYDHSATKHYAYIDGTLVGTANGTVYNNSTANFIVGVNKGDGSGYYNGKVQDIRYYHAVKYTSDFVPPSISPDVLPDTPSGVSGGSKLTKITDGAVSFDGTQDYLTSTSSDYAFGTGDFTVEAYVYLDSLINYRCLATTRPDNGGYSDAWHVGFNDAGGIPLYSNEFDLTAPVGSIGAKKWTHVAVTRDSSTARIFVDGKLVVSGTVTKNYTRTLLGVGDFPNGGIEPMKGQISNLRIIKGSVATEYQTSSTTAGTQIFTPPTRKLTNVTNTKLLCCQSNTSALAAAVSPTSGANDGTVWSESVTPSNTSTQFPLVRGFDGVITGDGGTSGFAGWLAGAGNITITFPSGVSVSNTINIYHGDGLSGSTTASITVDGTTTTSSASSGYVTTKSFTGVSGNLESITLTQAGGGVRFYGIAIDDTVLKDPLAANGNVVATTFNPFNTNINAVRGQESAYATMNPLDTEGLTLADGNLNVTNMGTSRQVHANIFVNSGKWYAEFTCKAAMNDTLFGVANNNGTSYLGSDTNSWGVISINGNRIHNQSQSSYGSSFTAGDVISVALDMDNGKWYAAKNGVYFDGGNPATGANPAYSNLTGPLTFTVGSNSTGGDVSCNFGQKPFNFSPPDGFQPLNAANVRPDTVIARPDQYFNATLWSGNNADPRQIDLGMAPDLIWVKARNQTNWHWLSDSLRGTANTRYKLYPNEPSAEDTTPIYGQADSFNDIGFLAGGGTDGSDSLSDSNKTGTNYICWSWKAGGSKFTYNKNGIGGSSASDIGVSATTLTLTGASINTTSKFGIYTYTGSGSGGATLNHGLGGTPGLVIYKKRTGSSSWQVYHQSLGGTQYMNLDEDTDAYTSDSTRFGGTNPTSSTISLGTHANGAGTVVLYAWCDVPGLQKFGSYVATGQTDGAYIELGFRPRFIICKSKSSNARNWMMFDSSRTTYNPMGAYLTADGNGTEGTYVACDFLRDGFKIRATSAQELNITNETFLYMAWAEAPTFNLYGAQSNAR